MPEEKLQDSTLEDTPDETAAEGLADEEGEAAGNGPDGEAAGDEPDGEDGKEEREGEEPDLVEDEEKTIEAIVAKSAEELAKGNPAGKEILERHVRRSVETAEIAAEVAKAFDAEKGTDVFSKRLKEMGPVRFLRWMWADPSSAELARKPLPRSSDDTADLKERVLRLEEELAESRRQAEERMHTERYEAAIADGLSELDDVLAGIPDAKAKYIRRIAAQAMETDIRNAIYRAGRHVDPAPIVAKKVQNLAQVFKDLLGGASRQSAHKTPKLELASSGASNGDKTENLAPEEGFRRSFLAGIMEARRQRREKS